MFIFYFIFEILSSGTPNKQKRINKIKNLNNMIYFYNQLIHKIQDSIQETEEILTILKDNQKMANHILDQNKVKANLIGKINVLKNIENNKKKDEIRKYKQIIIDCEERIRYHEEKLVEYKNELIITKRRLDCCKNERRIMLLRSKMKSMMI